MHVVTKSVSRWKKELVFSVDLVCVCVCVFVCVCAFLHQVKGRVSMWCVSCLAGKSFGPVTPSFVLLKRAVV